MKKTLKRTLIVNLYGGPGSGKSTMAARIFAELKDLGINCELATEYAKDVTWQKGFHILSNQLYIFAKQQHRIWRLDGQVDVIVTDSPLLNSLIYGSEDTSETFKTLVVEEYKKRNSLDIFLKRTKPYNIAGRSQTLDEAKEIDDRIYKILDSINAVHKYQFNGEKNSAEAILMTILDKLKQIKTDEIADEVASLILQRDEYNALKNVEVKRQQFASAAKYRTKERELQELIDSVNDLIKTAN